MWRRVFFALLGGVTLAVYATKRRGPVDDDGLLVTMGMLGAVWAVAIVVDTVCQAWIGQGVACIHCGHRRRMASFRLHPPCPKCGGE